MNRIKRIHLLIVAVVLFVGLAVAFFMVLVKPRQKNIADWDKKITDRQKVADQLPQAQAALADAKAQLGSAEAKWQIIMRTKMSHISLADPYRAIFAIYKEIPTYEPQLMAAFARDKRVKLNSRLGFSQYGFTPPPTSLVGRDYPQTLNLSAKSFPDLLSWLRNTESLPRVLELGGSIAISKSSAGISATVPGVIHIYFAELPAVSQSTAPETGTGTPSKAASPSVPGVTKPSASQPKGRPTKPSGDLGFRPTTRKK